MSPIWTSITLRTSLLKLLSLCLDPKGIKQDSYCSIVLVSPSHSTVEGFIEVMSVDKKNIHGNIRLVLLQSLGKAFISDDYLSEVMKLVIADNITK